MKGEDMGSETTKALKDVGSSPAPAHTDGPREESWLAGFGRALGLGVVTGLRSTSAFALLSRVKTGPEFHRERLPGWLFSKPAMRLFSAAAAGEFVVDKWPTIPSRLNRGPLIGRMVSGGTAGVASFRLVEKPAWAGWIPGSVGALAGSFAGARGRGLLVKRTGLPDPVIAVAEDVLALTAGRAILRRPWLGLALFALALVASLRIRTNP